MNRVAVGIILIMALLWGSLPAAAETLLVKFPGLSGRGGVVRVMIWRDAAGFPTKLDKAIQHKDLALPANELQVSFTGLSRGIYAVAAYLDENSNGVMDRSLLGWPVEPTAASNGVRGVLGPPSFADAAFELKNPSQTIQLVFK